jgi:hypothetical protein
MKTRRLGPFLLALLAIVVMAVAAGCGTDVGSSSGGTGGAGSSSLAAKFPKDSLAYLEMDIRPEGALRDNATSVLSKLSGKAPDEIGPWLSKSMQELLDEAEKEQGTKLGVAWTEMMAATGRRQAYALLGLSGKRGVALDDLDAEWACFGEVTSQAEAEALLRKMPSVKVKTVDGQKRYYDSESGSVSVVNGTEGISGSSDAVLDRMLAVADGQRLRENDKFTNAIGALDDQQLVMGYADVDGLLGEVEPLIAEKDRQDLEQVKKQLGAGGSAAALGMTAIKNGIAIDLASTGVNGAGAGGDGNEAMRGVPADAWLALGVSDFGEVLTKALNEIKDLGKVEDMDVKAEIEKAEQQLGLNLEQDLFSWMGDMAIFGRGTSAEDANGALVVKSIDDARSTKAIADIQRLLGQIGLKVKAVEVDGAKGIEVDAGGMPAVIVQKDGKVAIGLGQQAVRDGLSPSLTLGDSDALKRASEQLNGIDPSFYMGIKPIATIAKLSGDLSADDTRILDALDAVVAGTKTNGDVQHLKAALLVR